MKSAVIILVLAALYREGSALQCHVCVGTATSDCAKNVTASMGTQTCFKPKPHPHNVGASTQSPFFTEAGDTISTNAYVDDTNKISSTRVERDVSAEPDFDLRCIIITTKASKYGTGLVVKECGYTPKGKDICTVLRLKKRNIIDCNSCNADMCN